MLHDWYATGVATEQLPENKIVEVSAGEKRVCLLKRGAQLFAFVAKCPHASAPFCDGWVDALGLVVCPLHKYKFDPATGRNTTGEGYRLFRYQVEVRNGQVFVGW